MTSEDQLVERLHGIDPADWSWSESWFFSFVDLDDGPACTFRVGVTPNQGRAMVWCFLHVEGEWVTVEETRVSYADVDFSGDGVRYDKWGLHFESTAAVPLETGRFAFDGYGLVRVGAALGARIPFSIALDYSAKAPIHGTGVGEEDEGRTSHPTGRFEQSLVAEGTVVVDGTMHPVRAGAHRDKSWGPRDWRHNFVIGDLQGDGHELYFVGRTFPGEAGGYERVGDGEMQPLMVSEAELAFDDASRTIGPSRIVFDTFDGSGRQVEMSFRPLGPSIQFDIAHTVEEPEHWRYWRVLIEAEVSGWDAPVRGWFEAGRYGVA